MKSRLWALVSLSGFVAASALVDAAATITTFPAWNGTSSFAQMGDTPGSTATWGETFVPPGGNPVLTSFSFWLADSPVFDPDPLDFAGYLMEWNGQRAIGPILYQSSQMTADGMAHGEFRRFVFSPGLRLDPGKTYVFFVSSSEYFDGVPSAAYPGGLAADVYPSGHLVTLNNGSDFSQITGTNWGQVPGWDMVFEANFVSEPPITNCNPALNLTFGAGANAFNVCLSSEGNVARFESPAGADHSTGGEGYSLCAGSESYWDYGVAGASGFGTPTVVQPKGPGTLPIAITRKTADAAWELTQTFAKNNTRRDLTITMTVKRLGGPIGYKRVRLARSSDFDADGTVGGDIGDRSPDSIWARQDHAVSLTALSRTTNHYTILQEGTLRDSTCGVTSAATPIGPTHLAGHVVYVLGSFSSNEKKTVRFIWRMQ